MVIAMDKVKELKDLREKMRDADLPLKNGATKLVFGEGNPLSKILFIGEGPGYWEDQQGRPFVGNAGKLLDKSLEEIGLRRKDVFITNVVHYRPPENRDPEPAEIAAFQPYLDRIIEIIDPDVIVTLGRFSMGKFLPDVKISQVHGEPNTINWGRKRVVFPMYHPAAALRAGTVMESFKSDFKKLLMLI
jgi:uracil-DNA glycosylase